MLIGVCSTQTGNVGHYCVAISLREEEGGKGKNSQTYLYVPNRRGRGSYHLGLYIIQVMNLVLQYLWSKTIIMSVSD